MTARGSKATLPRGRRGLSRPSREAAARFALRHAAFMEPLLQRRQGVVAAPLLVSLRDIGAQRPEPWPVGWPGAALSTDLLQRHAASPRALWSQASGAVTGHRHLYSLLARLGILPASAPYDAYTQADDAPAALTVDALPAWLPSASIAALGTHLGVHAGDVLVAAERTARPGSAPAQPDPVAMLEALTALQFDATAGLASWFPPALAWPDPARRSAWPGASLATEGPAGRPATLGGSVGTLLPLLERGAGSTGGTSRPAPSPSVAGPPARGSLPADARALRVSVIPAGTETAETLTAAADAEAERLQAGARLYAVPASGWPGQAPGSRAFLPWLAERLLGTALPLSAARSPRAVAAMEHQALTSPGEEPSSSGAPAAEAPSQAVPVVVRAMVGPSGSPPYDLSSQLLQRQRWHPVSALVDPAARALRATSTAAVAAWVAHAPPTPTATPAPPGNVETGEESDGRATSDLVPARQPAQETLAYVQAGAEPRALSAQLMERHQWLPPVAAAYLAAPGAGAAVQSAESVGTVDEAPRVTGAALSGPSDAAGREMYPYADMLGVRLLPRRAWWPVAAAAASLPSLATAVGLVPGEPTSAGPTAWPVLPWSHRSDVDPDLSAALTRLPGASPQARGIDRAPVPPDAVALSDAWETAGALAEGVGSAPLLPSPVTATLPTTVATPPGALSARLLQRMQWPLAVAGLFTPFAGESGMREEIGAARAAGAPFAASTNLLAARAGGAADPDRPGRQPALATHPLSAAVVPSVSPAPGTGPWPAALSPAVMPPGWGTAADVPITTGDAIMPRAAQGPDPYPGSSPLSPAAMPPGRGVVGGVDVPGSPGVAPVSTPPARAALPLPIPGATPAGAWGVRILQRGHWLPALAALLTPDTGLGNSSLEAALARYAGADGAPPAIPAHAPVMSGDAWAYPHQPWLPRVAALERAWPAADAPGRHTLEGAHPALAGAPTGGSWPPSSLNAGVQGRRQWQPPATSGRPPLFIVPPAILDDLGEEGQPEQQDDRRAANAAPFTMLPELLGMVASIQRKAEPEAAPPTVERRTDALRQTAQSSGRPLDPTVQRVMQTVLAADFSDVRIHTGQAAAGAAAMISARAFTLGRDIFFAGGAFDTASPSGLALLGHELTHTMQQHGGMQRSALPGAGATTPAHEPAHLEEQALQAEVTLMRMFTAPPALGGPALALLAEPGAATGAAEAAGPAAPAPAAALALRHTAPVTLHQADPLALHRQTLPLGLALPAQTSASAIGDALLSRMAISAPPAPEARSASGDVAGQQAWSGNTSPPADYGVGTLAGAVVSRYTEAAPGDHAAPAGSALEELPSPAPWSGGRADAPVLAAGLSSGPLARAVEQRAYAWQGPASRGPGNMGVTRSVPESDNEAADVSDQTIAPPYLPAHAGLDAPSAASLDDGAAVSVDAGMSSVARGAALVARHAAGAAYAGGSGLEGAIALAATLGSRSTDQAPDGAATVSPFRDSMAVAPRVPAAVGYTSGWAQTSSPGWAQTSAPLAAPAAVVPAVAGTALSVVGAVAQRATAPEAASPDGATAPTQDARGTGAVGAATDAATAAGGAQPNVDELVDQVLSRLQRQLMLDHERAGGFLPDLTH